MLPLKNLDDKTFRQIFEDSRKLIQKFSPEWTDYNLHDPGITLLEMFSWLTEMQQYYLNRIRDDSYLKFLKLLDCGVRPSINAGASVCFSCNEVITVPEGTRLYAGDIPFETVEAQKLTDNNIDKILSCTDWGYVDNTQVNGREGLSYYCFGENAIPGDKMYIGFEKKLPKGDGFYLYFDVFDDYPVNMGLHIDGYEDDMGCTKSIENNCVWEIYCSPKQAEAQWVPLPVIKDETSNFTKGGRIFFSVPKDMGFYRGLDNQYDSYFIRCTIKGEELELAPKLKSIMINSVPVVQRNTYCNAKEINYTLADTKAFKLEPVFLVLRGKCSLQLKSSVNNLWMDCSKTGEVLQNSNSIFYKLVNLKESIKIELIDKNNVLIEGNSYQLRLLYWSSDFGDFNILGGSNGLPNQRFDLSLSDGYVQDIQLSVKVMREGEVYWQDWTRVEDFDSSGALDTHFVFDEKANQIVFGDGIKGAIPEVVDDSSIRIIKLVTGKGSGGNVEAGKISEVVQPYDNRNIICKNSLPAGGGLDPESIEEAQLRARRGLSEVQRAVTFEDIEKLALSTPGLRVARAKAIVNSQKTSNGRETNWIDVVVVPYSNKAKPRPGKKFISMVCRHLNLHRLITTEINVFPPEYVEVSVMATVVFKPGYKPDKDKVNNRLKEFLSPLGDGDGRKGWEFGRPVYVSEIYEVIENIDGVDYVNSVKLYASGSGWSLGEQGSVKIGPNSLVCSGIHRIEVS